MQRFEGIPANEGFQRGSPGEKIRGIDPDLIFVSGRDTLEKVRDISDIPILYTLVPTPHEIVTDSPNIIGLPMLTSPEKKFETITTVLPNVKSIGLIHMKRTEIIAEKIKRIAFGTGIRILSRGVEKSEDFHDALWEMEKKIDLFWMLPDIDLFTSGAEECLFEFSTRTMTPVFSFGDQWVKRGALLSSEVDLFDIGPQCARVSEKILAGADIESLKPLEPEKETLAINLNTAQELSVEFNKDMIWKMRRYWWGVRW